jgi:curved DNA-binding protein CbpA
MKRIIESRKLLEITEQTDLTQLKLIYRSLMKQWHPDKFREGHEQASEAEAKSKSIIEAYHFLVSVSPETHASYSEEYNNTINTCGIVDFEYKGSTLKVTFTDASIYEYFSIPRNIYIKLVNSATQARFARRHIFTTYLYRNVSKSALAA